MLSEQQHDILRFIHRYDAEYGFMPTLREIASAAGLSSSSVASYHIDRLIRSGYLVKMPSKSRAFSLTYTAYELLGEPQVETDVECLRAEIRVLRAENERLRLKHKAQLDGLRLEFTHVLRELHQLKRSTESSPA